MTAMSRTSPCNISRRKNGRPLKYCEVERRRAGFALCRVRDASSFRSERMVDAERVRRNAAFNRRASDFAARYGGEEFAVLLPGLDAKTAFNVAERIRAKVAKLGLKHRVSPFGIATVSIGVSCFAPTTGSDARDLITAADSALYQAKRLGRHRTEPAQPAGELTSTAPCSLPRPS